MRFLNEAKLVEIIKYINNDKYKQAHVVYVNEAGNIVQRWTAKKLEEGDFILLAEVSKGKKESAVRVCFYENGLALYCAEGRKTVLDVAKCVAYVYQYGLKTDWLPEKQKISYEELLSMKWYHALALFGETRIENNIMNDTASRLGVNANEHTNVDDDGDSVGVPYNTEDQQAVDPAKAVIYNECIEESLNTLSNKQKVVFISTVLEEKTDSETSKSLKIERSTVTKRRKQALQIIRANRIWK